MNRKEDEEQFEISIPPEEPVFPLNVVCRLIDMNYWTIHEILKEGIINTKKKKKLFSFREVKRLRYVKYLMEVKGVNIKGIKVIFEIESKEE